jgi:superfamily II DNA or RNA helicase
VTLAGRLPWLCWFVVREPREGPGAEGRKFATLSPRKPDLETFPPLRAWQRKALVDYLRRRSEDFMAVATPGAGKTTFALRIAAELLADGTVEAVTVVCPTEHLKTQWAQAAARVGIELDHSFRNSDVHSSRDFHGAVLTYAQVGMAPAVHRRRTMTRSTFVILDEIHHAGDSRTWGDGVKSAFEPATRRLMLTGTPFRSDENPIPFVVYERGEDGLQRSRSDSSYGYADALRDGVVRPVIFMAYSGETRWRTNAGDELAARLGEPMTKDLVAQAWRTALDHRGDWMPQVLRAADARLGKLRQHGMTDAGGLVIASDQQTARAYAKLLHEITGEPAVVVLSDDEGASGRIASFAASEQRWLVAVRMVSEGVDIPRLAVGVYATSASTPLYFAQAIGRFVRARREGETATVFLPSVPHLLGLAGEMEAQRDHVLGAPKQDDGLDDDLLERAQREEKAEGELEKQFEALSATAELDQVIFDGTSFGTGARSGTPEEEEYLGIPGLLTADQVAVVLNKRQAEQVAAQKKRKAGPEVPAPRPEPVPMSAGERRNSLRRQLNTLVAAHHHRTNLPHGKIHAELRRLCGGPPSAQATIEQLEERIATIQTL